MIFKDFFYVMYTICSNCVQFDGTRLYIFLINKQYVNKRQKQNLKKSRCMIMIKVYNQTIHQINLLTCMK